MTQVQCKGKEANKLSLMTYNIRLNTESDGDNAWPLRKEYLAGQVEYHHPDVLGTQEALPDQIDWLNEHLEDYAYVGEGRRGGHAGEYSAIFYNRHELKVNRSGTFWLSTTPTEVSTGWDAALPRICTWAEFVRHGDGAKPFLVFNTHFDHVGVEARKNSADVILTHLDSLNPGGLPGAVIGDLNLTPETVPIQKFAAKLTDAHLAAAVKLGPDATFKGFENTVEDDRRIDYIFLTPGVEVERYAVLTDWVNGAHPSDHYPVVAQLDLRPTPLVIAHRGASGYAVENTLPAFQKALDLGSDMIELDVFTLADGEVICFHDDGLKRLTGTEGKVTDMTISELNQLLVDGKYRIPRLTEVLDLVAHRLRINVELKGPGTAGPVHGIIQDYVAKHGWKIGDFHISSFRHDELRKMRKLNERVDIGILPHGSPLDALEVAGEVGAVSINAHHASLNPESVKAMHDAGLKIYSWTVNDYATIRRLLDLGIDGFITNYPDRVFSLAGE